ncbi:MAG: DNA-binding response regulator [Bacteroidetes bacterium]|nr:MAG: DNA-binding response regulator [Bacteroidota bacterium]
MIKCIIVEDEILAQQVIENHLKKFDRFELVAVCNNAADAMIVLKQKEVDLIFLDIQLPGVKGLQFLRSLVDPPLVILTTAYGEYALESYEFNVIDYLLKPISLERFTKAVNKVTDSRLISLTANEQRAQADHIFIKSNNKFFKVNFSEIIFVQAMKDYLKIHTSDYRLVTHQTMNYFESILPSDKFIRVHKSFIVAISYIKSIYGNSVETMQATIPIGNNYKDAVMSMVSKKNK